MDHQQDFIAAIQTGDLEKTRNLLAKDATLASARDSSGVSAIMHALYRQRAEMLKVLLSAKPRLDIFESASLGRTHQISELIGGDPALVNAWSGDGFTPLHLACFFAKEDAVTLLLQHGAQVDRAARNPMKVMPLHSAAAGHNLVIVRLLLEHGAPPNAPQQLGWTALHEAAQQGDAAMLNLLLKHGADPSAKNDDGVTALQLATEKGHTEISRVLGAA